MIRKTTTKIQKPYFVAEMEMNNLQESGAFWRVSLHVHRNDREQQDLNGSARSIPAQQTNEACQPTTTFVV